VPRLAGHSQAEAEKRLVEARLTVGAVRGFAFTLGLTTLVDLVVVFLFTHPTVALLARTKFFGGGHKLSGFDPEHLGRTVVYAGRGRVRTPAETAAPNAEPDDVFATAGAPTTTATTAAQRSGSRTTIAERRAAAERAARGDGDEPSAERAADTGAATSGRDA